MATGGAAPGRRGPAATLLRMLVPLAVSGKIAIVAIVVPSALGIWLLLRAERRDEERDAAKHAPPVQPEQGPGSADGHPPAF